MGQSRMILGPSSALSHSLSVRAECGNDVKMIKSDEKHGTKSDRESEQC